MLDIIIKIIFIYLIYRGWSKGLLRSILGPFSLISSLAISFFYYKKTGKLLNAIGISILGPFIINITVSLLLKIWNKTIDNAKISIPSRISGSIFSLLWSGSYIIALLVLILQMPSNAGFLQNIQNYIRRSQTYAFLNKWTPLASLEAKNIMRVFEDPENVDKINKSKEFQTLLKNDKFKEVMNNEKVQALIKNKDFAGLLSDPNVQSMMKDKELLKHLMDANKMLIEKAADQNSKEGNKSTKPYVMGINTDTKEN